MMTEIVILTKSTMKGGFCVSGLRLDSGEWIRLVADKNSSPLSGLFMKYQNADGLCEPLDVVSADIAEHVPNNNQQENFRIKADTMNKIDTFSIQDVVKLHPPEKHEYVFGSPFDSLSDDEMRQCKFQYSLILIQVRKLTVHIRKNGSKADFEYNGKTYKDIRITDPDYAQADLTYSTSIGKAYLVVSMPARPDVRRSGRWYKFVAKIYL